MSEYGYKENTETPVDTSPEMSDAQIDDSGAAEQADADFDADTDSGFEAGEEMPEDHSENIREASDAEIADADFDRDAESNEQSELTDESEEDFDHSESFESEQFEDAEDNGEDIDSENTEDTAEDVDSENTEDNAEDVDAKNTEDNGEDVESENTEDTAEDVGSENTEDNAEEVDDVDTEYPEETIEDSDEAEEDNEEVPEEEFPAEEEAEEPVENQGEEAESQEKQQEEKQQEKAQEKAEKAANRPAIAPMPISKRQQEASEKTESQPESGTSPVSRGGSQEVAAMHYESAAIVAPAELGNTITPEHADRGDEHKDSEEKSADEADTSADEDQSSSASPSAQQDEDQQAGQTAANNAQIQTAFSDNSGQIVPNNPQSLSSITSSDPQVNAANAPASSQDKQEEAFQALLAYMAAHNYGRQDAPIYQNDPEWQKLQRAAYPDWTPPKSAEARRMEELRPGTIPAASILDVDSSGEYFWQEHSLTKADYLALARDIPEVQQRMDSGASLEELKKDPRLGACATAYFDPAEMVKVEHDQNGFHFGDNGRHRIAAARELGINMPVLIIERNPGSNVKGNEIRQPVQETREQTEESLEAKNLEIGEVRELSETFKRFEGNEKELLENQKLMADLELPGQRMKGVQANGIEGAADQIDKVRQNLEELREHRTSIGVKTEVEALVAARYQRIGRISSEVLREMQKNRKTYEWAVSERNKLAGMGNGKELTSEQVHELESGKAALSAYLSENSEVMLQSFGLTPEEYQRKIASLSDSSPWKLRQEYGKIGTLAWDRQSELSWKSWKETPQRSAEYVLAHGDKAELQQLYTFDKRNVACMIALAQAGDGPRTIGQTEKTCQAVLERWNHEHPDQPVSTQFSAEELARISIGADLISDKKRDTVARIGGDHIESTKEIQESSEFDPTAISPLLEKDIEMAKKSIGNNPDRKKEWDIVRARYADDMRKESERLKQLEVKFDAEFMDCYTKIKQVEKSELPAAQKEALLKQYNDGFMKAYLARENARTSSNDALAKSMELSKGLEGSRKSKFVGVGGNDHLEISQGLIREQGRAVPDFKGTCGCCSCANAMTLLGEKTGEKEVVMTARKIGACTDEPEQPINRRPINEWLNAERIRIASNGGTDAMDRKEILTEFGFSCKNTFDQSLSDLHSHISKGEAVVFNLDASVLNKKIPTMAFATTNHAVCITGLEVDEQTGEAIGVWIRDTGNNSDMGCNVFFEKKDFDLLMNNCSCSVQYVSKREA